MRVVGGAAKGRRLKGAVVAGARPTTERVRAAIFNILEAEKHPIGRVLDLFAGSGSLGIEALSRGAEWADFVELDRRQCRVIRSNLEATGFSSVAGVLCSDVKKSLPGLVGPYQLVLMDPPYRMGDLGSVIEGIGTTPGLVAAGGMVVVGHSRHVTLEDRYGCLGRKSVRRYGDNVVEFYRRDNET